MNLSDKDAARNRRPRPVAVPGMHQIVQIDSAVSALVLTVAPGLVIELVFDDEGLLVASWQGPGWWRLAEIGEA